MSGTGPLSGVRIVEFEAIGPCPFAAMMLSDLGAEVVTIARPGKTRRNAKTFIWRGRHWVEKNLKDAADLADVKALVARADILIEGFRPGVMERLGLGPEAMHAASPGLVYGRMTGWGQEGPLASVAGHDINYIAITGALNAFRARDGYPVSPLNIAGDYGGGAMYLLVGLLAALHEARNSGKGQVVDAAMCDGVSHLLTMFRALIAQGAWDDAPRRNRLDGGAHFYNVYACKDGKFMALGAYEPQFYARLREIIGLDAPEFDDQLNRAQWPALTGKLEAVFRKKTRDEWIALLEHEEACATGVLSMTEAYDHPHLVARKVFVACDGEIQPAPAPRFSRSPAAIQHSPAAPATTSAAILARWGGATR